MFVCLCVCTKVPVKRVLNGGEYDIGWDNDWNYDVQSLKLIHYYSKLLVIWAESNPPQEQALKSTLNGL